MATSPLTIIGGPSDGTRGIGASYPSEPSRPRAAASIVANQQPPHPLRNAQKTWPTWAFWHHYGSLPVAQRTQAFVPPSNYGAAGALQELSLPGQLLPVVNGQNNFPRLWLSLKHYD